MTIDKAIRLFAQFLNVSWDLTSDLLDDRDYTTNEMSRYDWLQANWELLVERKVLPIKEYLEIYGEGADFYGEYSRITDRKAKPSYQIKIRSKTSYCEDILNGKLICGDNLSFDRLMGYKNKFYISAPPFNYVLVFDNQENKERLVLLSEIVFDLEKCQ